MRVRYAKQPQREKKSFHDASRRYPQESCNAYKRNALIAASYLINVFSVTVSRKIGKDEILYWSKL